MKKSKLFKLHLNDFTKGLIVAIITACLTVAYQMLTNCADMFSCLDFKQIASTAILAAMSYLMKNLVTNSDGKILKKDDPSL